jgi:hypothetical protein
MKHRNGNGQHKTDIPSVPDPHLEERIEATAEQFLDLKYEVTIHPAYKLNEKFRDGKATFDHLAHLLAVKGSERIFARFENLNQPDVMTLASHYFDSFKKKAAKSYAHELDADAEEATPVAGLTDVPSGEDLEIRLEYRVPMKHKGTWMKRVVLKPYQIKPALAAQKWLYAKTDAVEHVLKTARGNLMLASQFDREEFYHERGLILLPPSSQKNGRNGTPRTLPRDTQMSERRDRIALAVEREPRAYSASLFLFTYQCPKELVGVYLQESLCSASNWDMPFRIFSDDREVRGPLNLFTVDSKTHWERASTRQAAPVLSVR